MMQVLAESGVAEQVEIDENGGKSLTVLAWLISQVSIPGSWATSKPWSNRILKADLVAPRR